MGQTAQRYKLPLSRYLFGDKGLLFVILVIINNIILLYKLKCLIGISTTEKNRITTLKKLR